MNGYAVYPFPFGQLKIEYQDGAVTSLVRSSEPVRSEGRTPLTGLVFQQVTEYLNGQRRAFDFPYILRGTAFQQKVWQALCAIPYGETRTYGEIAAAAGNPRAARAVENSCFAWVSIFIFMFRMLCMEYRNLAISFPLYRTYRTMPSSVRFRTASGALPHCPQN